MPIEPVITKQAPRPGPHRTCKRDSGRMRLPSGRGRDISIRIKYKEILKMFEHWGGEALLIKTLSAFD